MCEVAGADGITLHLREDRRHIQDRDLELLREVSLLPLTLEMAPTDEMVSIACRVKPVAVTLVPERRMELTTEGGLDAVQSEEILKPVIEKIREAEIAVCLFLEPVKNQIQKAAGLGCNSVEIHTGKYAEVWAKRGRKAASEIAANIESAVEFGVSLGLQMNAGHGIDYQNIRPLARISGLDEFSIGHAIVSRSLFTGLERAVREMAELIR